MNDNTEKKSLRGSVMDAIKKGEVQMRPRWHFAALSLFALVGIVLVVLTLLYLVSLAVFFMRESGVWFAPSFGMRGWFEFARSLPWLLIGLTIVFLVLLELLVRRYSFVYQKPLVASVAAGIIIISIGGFVIARTPFHRTLYREANHQLLPPPIGILYRAPFRTPHPPEVYHGTIFATSTSGFVVVDIDGEGTSSVVITPQTRLPYGADFSTGDLVVVFGDRIGTDTIQAFGIREISE